MDYRNKLVLAPMIRVGTLLFRLLAAEYGADITYGEEIIDHRLLKCERRFNGSWQKLILSFFPILITLKRNLDTPVTCKIRLLKSSQDTVELARRIEKTGVSALAIHGRKVADRPRVPAKWSEIADVVAAVSISVIENGDVFEYKDIQRIKVAIGR